MSSRKTILLSLLVVLLIGGAFAGGFFVKKPSANVEVASESHTSQIVTAVEGQEQLVLMSANIQGLREERTEGKWRDWRIPGSGRVQFIQFEYRAKFGLEGKDVVIAETEPDTYLITVPEFIFIGHDDVTFKTAVEDGGVLKWMTPDIDTAEVITQVLNDETKQAQIDDNRDLLQDQTQYFYEGIIRAIDQNAVVEFAFQ